MDKPKRPYTITIKLNGNNRPDKEKKEEELKVDKTIKKKGEGFQTYDEHNNEIAVAKERLDDEEDFEWVLPDEKSAPIEKIHRDDETSKKANKEKKFDFPKPQNPFKNKQNKLSHPDKKKLLMSVGVTVICAIVIGTILGLTMLNIVLPGQKASNIPVEEQQTVKENETPVAPTGTEIIAKSISTFVVQEGLYSSEEAAKQVQSQLKQEGTPVGLINMNGMGMDGKFALFIGTWSSLEHAKTIGTEFNSSEIETFSKEIVINEKKLTGQGEQDNKFLELLPQMYGTMVESATSKSMTNDISASLKEKLGQQTKALGEMNKDKLENDSLKGLYTEIENASEQLKIYDEKPDASTRNKLQQHLLTILELYRKL